MKKSARNRKLALAAAALILAGCAAAPSLPEPASYAVPTRDECARMAFANNLPFSPTEDRADAPPMLATYVDDPARLYAERFPSFALRTHGRVSGFYVRQEGRAYFLHDPSPTQVLHERCHHRFGAWHP